MGLFESLTGARKGRSATVMQAIWKDTVLAESADTISVDGRRYFPADDIRWDFLQVTDKETVCAWKGVARYYDIEVDGRRKRAAAWVYPEPAPAAAALRDRVAFQRGVRVRPVGSG